MKKKVSTNEKTVRVILALILAVAIWFVVNGTSTDLVEQDISGIPVTLNNIESLQEKHLVLEDNRSYYVNLTVRGTDKSLYEINPKELTAEVDMSEINAAGEQQLKVNIKGLSNSVILQEVTPSTLTLNVQNVSDSEKEVTVVTDGKPADGNAVVSAKTDDTVTLTGPEDLLSEVSEVTATLDVNGMSQNSDKYVEVVARDQNGNALDDVICKPSAVKVSVIIGLTKNVKINTPQTTGTVADGYKVTKVTVEPDVVTIGGLESVLRTIDSLSVDAIDVSGASKSVTKDMALQLPEGASLLESGQKVKVTVEIESLVEKNFTVNHIEARNLGTGLTVAKVDDSSAVVKIRAVASELNKINTDAIHVWLDLKDLGKGDHEVSLQVEIPAGEVVSVTPAKTNVKIE